MKAEKVYDQTFTARNFNTSPLTISGLKGDLYDYELIIQTPGTTTYSYYYLTLNSDTTANYRAYGMRGRATSAAATVSDTASSLNLFESGSTGQTDHLAMVKITGSSGDERYLDAFYSSNDNTNNSIWKKSLYWKNTADEVTSITFTSGVSVTIDAHIILYRTPKEASQEKWELVDTYSGTSVNYNTETEIFNGLDGNQDIQYKMVLRYDAGTNSDLGFRINSDSAASQYINQDLRNSGGSIQAGNNSRSHCQFTGSTGAENGLTDVEVIINAETGNRRLIVISYANINAGTDQSETAAWYKDTATNISTLELYDPISVTTNSLTAKLYRRKNPNTIGDTLPFEMVEEVAVSGDFSAGHTFSVNGDDVLLYKLEFIGDTGETAPDLQMRCQLNGDTASNYPRQWLRGYGSTTNAVSSTLSYFLLGSGVYGESKIEFYLYPKSGENRPLLSTAEERYNGGYQVLKQGAWWSNSVDNINSIKVYAGGTTSLTGTLKLSRLYKGLRKQVNTFGFGASKGAYTADSTDFQMTTMSATAWVYLNSGYNTDGAIQGQFGASGNRSWYYRVDSGKTVAALFCSNGSTIGTGNIMTTTTTLNTEQWYMLTFVLDGSNCYIYINDGLDLTKAYSSGLFNSTNNFEIGYLSNYSVDFDGDITGVQVYKNTALTADDVSQLYNNGIVRKYSSLPTGLQGTAAWELTDRDNTGNDLGSTNNLTFVGSTTDDGVSILYNK